MNKTQGGTGGEGHEKNKKRKTERTPGINREKPEDKQKRGRGTTS